MPYSAEHKQATRQRITEAARVLFNRHGFVEVSIDMVMAEAGLTRGGFYNHFNSKEALYQAAVSSFLMGRGAQWREEAGVDAAKAGAEATRQMVDSYLSSEHLGDLDGQCPMIALPSDIARSTPEVRESYQELLSAMIGLFKHNLSVAEDEAVASKKLQGASKKKQRDGQASVQARAQAMAALCIGGMVIAKTLPDTDFANEVRAAARTVVHQLSEGLER